MTWKKLAFFGVFLAVFLPIILSASLSATPERNDNCLSCHSGSGIVLNSNAASSLKANASGFFQIEVTAEGNAQDLTLKWPSALNPSFTFSPSTVVDDGSNDLDPAANKVRAIFEVNTPLYSGNYTIQVFAADGALNGASLSFQVNVTEEGGPIGPSKGERLTLWTVQTLTGSLMIVFTSIFAVGIASTRLKSGGKNG